VNLPTWFGMEEFNAWELHWAADNAVWPLLILGVVIPLTLWFFWTSLSRIVSPGRRYFLYSLRVITLVLLLLVVLQPQLELKHIQPMRNVVAVLLDDSKSLSVKTFPQEQPRAELVRRALAGNRDYFERLKKTHQVDFYFVSDHLDPVSHEAAPGRFKPRGFNTDFTRVFMELQKRYNGPSLQGVILFSDGADLTQPEGAVSSELADQAARFEGPVHTLMAGSAEGFKDLGIHKLEVSDFGFIHQPVRLTATVTAQNLGQRSISVVLKEGDKILASRVLALHPGQERYQVELQFTPGLTGKRLYTLSLPLFAGEAVEVNNQVHFQVNVVRDRIRVLHLNGRPSWDSRFLREVLVNNPKVDLLSFFILRTLSDDVMATTPELSLIPFPSNLLFNDYLNSFDLVIFQNFRFIPFIDKNYLPNIKKFVEQGGGFLMIGGDLAFQAGGYQRTAVEDILPVQMDRNSKWYVTDEFKTQVMPALARHPVLRLEKDDARNLEAWGTMPALQGLNVGLVPVKGAQVLAGYSGADGQGIHPVVAARQIGLGRSLVLATDTSWNWNFLRVGQGGSGRYYQKFWENVIAWMTRDPQTDPIHLETDKERYREEETVLVQFQAQGRDYNPLPETPVQLVIRSLPAGRELVRQDLKTDNQGTGRFEFMPPAEGFYSVEVGVERAGETMKKEARFSVFSPTIEFQKPQVNPRLMRTLAEITGGVFQELGDTTRLDALSFPNPDYEIKTSSRTFSLWDSWWSYGLIVGCLFGEWWVRRKSGLS